MPRTVKNAQGEWVRVADDVTPERLEQITGGNSLGPNGILRVNIPNPRTSRREAEVKRRADEAAKSSMPTVQDTARGAARGLTMSFSDEMAGGLSGAAAALSGGDFSEEYTTARDTERELQRRAEQRSPIASTVGEIAGAVVNPIGVVGKAKAVGQGATLLAKAANALRGPVGSAAATGAIQGGLNAAGSAEDMANVPDAVANGVLIGGGIGGATGAAMKFGSGFVNAVRDRAPEAAERVAYAKAGERIRQAGKTPQQVQDDLANANANYSDMRFMDTGVGPRSDAAYTARRPSLSVSNEMQDLAEQRIADRGERFTDNIARQADTPSFGTTDSDDVIEGIIAKRKADGKADYAVGGAMDARVNWSQDLEDFWANAPDDTNATMRAARREIEGRRGNPDDYMIPSGAVTPQGDPMYTIVPTLRAFDYMKRGFNSEIGMARKAGDEGKVQRLQSEYSEFKRLFAEANPGDEYAQLLLRQRTQFEREAAVKQGQQVLKRIGGGRQEARQELKRIQQLQPHEREEYRTAILDGLLGMDAKANPLGLFKAAMRNEKQRQIMEFTFGGAQQLDNFNEYLKRELKSQATDRAMQGPPSQGSAHLVAEQSDESVGNVFNQILRGYLVAGTGGALSNTYRGMGNLARGMGKDAQEKYGEILMSDGSTLARKVGESDEFYARRAARLVRRSKMAAKGLQQIPTDQLGKK